MLGQVAPVGTGYQWGQYCLASMRSKTKSHQRQSFAVEGRTWALDALAHSLFAATHPHEVPSSTPPAPNPTINTTDVAAPGAADKPGACQGHNTPILLPMAPPSSNCRRLGPFRPLHHLSGCKPTSTPPCGSAVPADTQASSGEGPPPQASAEDAREAGKEVQAAAAAAAAGAVLLPMAPPPAKPNQGVAATAAGGSVNQPAGERGEGEAMNGVPHSNGNTGHKGGGTPEQQQQQGQPEDLPQEQVLQQGKDGGAAAEAHRIRELSRRRKMWYKRSKARVLASTLELPCDPDMEMMAAALDAANQQQAEGQQQQVQQQQQQQQQQQEDNRTGDPPERNGNHQAEVPAPPSSNGNSSTHDPSSSKPVAHSSSSSADPSSMVVCACCWRPCHLSCLTPVEREELHKSQSPSSASLAAGTHGVECEQPQLLVGHSQDSNHKPQGSMGQARGEWFCGPACEKVAAALAGLCASGRLPLPCTMGHQPTAKAAVAAAGVGADATGVASSDMEVDKDTAGGTPRSGVAAAAPDAAAAGAEQEEGGHGVGTGTPAVTHWQLLPLTGVPAQGSPQEQKDAAADGTAVGASSLTAALAQVIEKCARASGRC
eukprot:1143354-Pelagomonas_calceolata.AAC.10